MKLALLDTVFANSKTEEHMDTTPLIVFAAIGIVLAAALARPTPRQPIIYVQTEVPATPRVGSGCLLLLGLLLLLVLAASLR